MRKFRFLIFILLKNIEDFLLDKLYPFRGKFVYCLKFILNTLNYNFNIRVIKSLFIEMYVSKEDYLISTLLLIYFLNFR